MSAIWTGIKTLAMIGPMILTILKVIRDIQKAKRQANKEDAEKWRQWGNMAKKERMKRVEEEAKRRLDDRTSEPFDERKKRLLADDCTGLLRPDDCGG